jgi:hypothetical protein
LTYEEHLMPVSPTRNTISVEFDGDVWRSKLGSDDATGITSCASCPFDAISLTLAKAREQGWAFDGDKAAEPAKPVPAPAKPAPAPAPPAAS